MKTEAMPTAALSRVSTPTTGSDSESSSEDKPIAKAVALVAKQVSFSAQDAIRVYDKHTGQTADLSEHEVSAFKYAGEVINQLRAEQQGILSSLGRPRSGFNPRAIHSLHFAKQNVQRIQEIKETVKADRNDILTNALSPR